MTAPEIEHRGGSTIPDWALHRIHGVEPFRHDGDRAVTLRLLPVVEWCCAGTSPTSMTTARSVMSWSGT
jgi:hypothetical protein